MTIRRFSIALALLGIAAAGCKREEQALGDMDPRPRGPAAEEGHRPDPAGRLLDHAQIEQRIVHERCAFEERCNQVGAGRPFESESACVSRVAEDWKSDIASCNGLRPDALDACLEAMRARTCREPIGRLDSVSACNVQDLCSGSSR